MRMCSRHEGLEFRSPPRGQSWAAALAMLCFAAPALHGVVCNVPSGSYPTIAAALAAPVCDPIQIAPGTYSANLFIARDVTLAGAGSGSTTIAGSVEVSGGATDAVLDALRIDATAAAIPRCSASGLDVRGGARTSGVDLVVVRAASTAPCMLFGDGFESGGSSAWSAAVP